jgi:hypothetical protein
VRAHEADALYACSLFDSKGHFEDKPYWEAVKLNIWAKRSEIEKEIEQHYFIQLSREEQQLSLDLQKRELWEFGKEMGFEVGSYVLGKNGKRWKVTWISSGSGLLRIDDIWIPLENEKGDWVSLWSRTGNSGGLSEDKHFDYYFPC